MLVNKKSFKMAILGGTNWRGSLDQHHTDHSTVKREFNLSQPLPLSCLMPRREIMIQMTADTIMTTLGDHVRGTRDPILGN